MPIVKLFTNQKIVNVNFLKEFTSFLATTLNKPNNGIFVMVKDQETLALGGEAVDDRVVVLELKAIGIMNKSANVKFSEAITKYLSSTIDVKLDKIIIDFTPLDPGFVGKQGTTVEELLKSKQ